MTIVALLDANVLWSAALRDLLLRAARAGVFQPVWSDQILDELKRTLVERRRLDPTAIERTVGLMQLHFPTASVRAYEHRIPAMANNVGDRHVLAAAVEARARVLVTWNRRHFPASACDPHGIEVQIPDEFLCHLWQLDAEGVVAALTRQAAGLQHPPRTPLEVLQTLQRTVPTFAGRVLDAHVF